MTTQRVVTIDQLRRLRDAGNITQQEFNVAAAAIQERIQAGATPVLTENEIDQLQFRPGAGERLAEFFTSPTFNIPGTDVGVNVPAGLVGGGVAAGGLALGGISGAAGVLGRLAGAGVRQAQFLPARMGVARLAPSGVSRGVQEAPGAVGRVAQATGTPTVARGAAQLPGVAQVGRALGTAGQVAQQRRLLTAGAIVGGGVAGGTAAGLRQDVPPEAEPAPEGPAAAPPEDAAPPDDLTTLLQTAVGADGLAGAEPQVVRVTDPETGEVFRFLQTGDQLQALPTGADQRLQLAQRQRELDERARQEFLARQQRRGEAGLQRQFQAEQAAQQQEFQAEQAALQRQAAFQQAVAPLLLQAFSQPGAGFRLSANLARSRGITPSFTPGQQFQQMFRFGDLASLPLTGDLRPSIIPNVRQLGELTGAGEQELDAVVEQLTGRRLGDIQRRTQQLAPPSAGRPTATLGR